MARANVQFPAVLQPLFEPHRYKVSYGGRGAARSWSFARALLVKGSKQKLRILCARELQKSIKDSVHLLLKDQVSLLGLESFYDVQAASIRGKNGTEFIFEGLRHNSSQIKSKEGIDIAWVEEAERTSKASWDYLIPTIRKDGSEIWITFNSELEEDETYQRFVLHPPPDAFVVKMTYKDNPWFPETLAYEMEVCKERDIDDYNNIWLGHCRQAVQGAIYANEIQKAHEAGRICEVPYDPSLPVSTFWDLGYADMTSIWFIQKAGLTYHVIDFLQGSGEGMPYYIEQLQKKNYVYAGDYLPWDGASSGRVAIGKSCKNVAEDLGRNVTVVPQQGVSEGIEAVRTVFNACYFDKDKCADGLQSLRRYRYAVNENTGIVSRNPLHDQYSHGADAFRTFATAPHIQWEVFVTDNPINTKPHAMKHEYNPFDTKRL